jgi:hypothetical protein
MSKKNILSSKIFFNAKIPKKNDFNHKKEFLYENY